MQHVPKRIFVEMEVNTFPRYDALPHNWVPIPPTTTDWSLDHAEAIQIKRRGFAMSPDFSSTIHSATGRTLESAVPDLGSIEDVPNAQKAMEGYIALSRATSAEGVIIAQPFSALLFRQGPAPYPTLLLQVLKGQVAQHELAEKLEGIETADTGKLLKNLLFQCGKCGEELPCIKFVRLEKTLRVSSRASFKTF